jgi:hypothetical protein
LAGIYFPFFGLVGFVADGFGIVAGNCDGIARLSYTISQEAIQPPGPRETGGKNFVGFGGAFTTPANVRNSASASSGLSNPRCFMVFLSSSQTRC